MKRRLKIDIINPEIFKELATKYPEKAERARKKYKNFEKWLKGEDFPTYNQLVGLSKIFGIPFGDFFLDKLPEKTKYHMPPYKRFEFQCLLIKDLKQRRKKRTKPI